MSRNRLLESFTIAGGITAAGLLGIAVLKDTSTPKEHQDLKPGTRVERVLKDVICTDPSTFAQAAEMSTPEGTHASHLSQIVLKELKIQCLNDIVLTSEPSKPLAPQTFDATCTADRRGEVCLVYQHN